MGPRSDAAIDYLVMNSEGKEGIEEMKVGHRMKSDHLPLEMRIEEMQKRHEMNKEVQKWDTEVVKEYRVNLRRDSRVTDWFSLVHKIKEAISKEEGMIGKMNSQKWWDGGC
ncbi:hypothetical protein QAD02_007549 [Eretmocerus hayati]|uniref:Uncharacterized protein n=1 Tax=Eretmocerus hayati TaxID=131215 RepID=A0ACC2N4A8_9HYME|nr:hypothetical protein QAD02_007549 [Eretmocerus hayati]